MDFKNWILKIFIIFVLSANAQDMNVGFNYLEKGEFSKAELFFSEILINHPDNKTAKLCYGRSVGLNGNPQKANTLFKDLLKEYPNDFEIKLNYGESLLWTNDYNNAKLFFEVLINEDPNSFAALLSYANTLSNLKEYANALIFVDKALLVSPENLNALTSKKYMYLGYAYQKQQLKNFEEAEILLKENLKIFKNDYSTLLNLANLYLIKEEFDKAEAIYEIIAENDENTTVSLNGIALIKYLKGKNKEALKVSYQALKSIKGNTNETLKNQTQERHIQALIWNKKFKTANHQIDSLINSKPNENWILSLNATLNIYKSDFKKSIENYNRILINDSSSFDGNLGKANSLKALGKYNEAYNFANSTLKFYDKQKDAINFINNLDLNFTPFAEIKTSHSFDNGNNKAYAISSNIELPTSIKFKLLTNFGHRITNNKITNYDATSKDFSIGFNYQILPNVIIKNLVGITSASVNSINYTKLVTELNLNFKPIKLQILDVGYKSEIQSFNAELLSRKIVMNNIYSNYNLNTTFNLGLFTQYFYTWQSDNNKRNLLFTSLYYNILNKPSMKTGINYQFLTYKNQIPTIYFSPKRFNAFEIFININKDENIAKNKEFYYELSIASGLQYIENEKSLKTYRVQTKLGYKFSEYTYLNFYGLRSNIASATAAGFTFNEIGLRFKWHFLNKPIYLK